MLARRGSAIVILAFFGIGISWEQASGAPLFIRGDCNGDGSVSGEVSDAITILQFGFLGLEKPPCLAACDVNGNGKVADDFITDAIYLLTFNFFGTAAPPAPYPGCGPAPDPSDVDCQSYPPCSQPPIANFTATPKFGAAPLEVTFDASASLDPDGRIASYEWRFGDGQKEAERIVRHRYEKPGVFIAQLTVTDGTGLKKAATKLINASGVGQVLSSPYREVNEMSTPRYLHQTIQLQDGTILVAGGSDERGFSSLSSGHRFSGLRSQPRSPSKRSESCRHRRRLDRL